MNNSHKAKDVKMWIDGKLFNNNEPPKKPLPESISLTGTITHGSKKALELIIARAVILAELEHLKRTLKAIDDIPPAKIEEESGGDGLFIISKADIIKGYEEHEKELLKRLKELDNE